MSSWDKKDREFVIAAYIMLYIAAIIISIFYTLTHNSFPHYFFLGILLWIFFSIGMISMIIITIIYSDKRRGHMKNVSRYNPDTKCS